MADVLGDHGTAVALEDGALLVEKRSCDGIRNITENLTRIIIDNDFAGFMDGTILNNPGSLESVG